MPRAKAELISTEDMMRAAGIRIATSQVSIRAEAAGAAVGRLLEAVGARAGAGAAPQGVRRRRRASRKSSRVWFCSDAYELVCTESPGPPKTSSTSAMSRRVCNATNDGGDT